jgi:hypothetical protein
MSARTVSGPTAVGRVEQGLDSGVLVEVHPDGGPEGLSKRAAKHKVVRCLKHGRAHGATGGGAHEGVLPKEGVPSLNPAEGEQPTEELDGAGAWLPQTKGASGACTPPNPTSL